VSVSKSVSSRQQHLHGATSRVRWDAHTIIIQYAHFSCRSKNRQTRASSERNMLQPHASPYLKYQHVTITPTFKPSLLLHGSLDLPMALLLLLLFTAIVYFVSISVFARSNAGIVGSNPTQGMDVCVHLSCVYVVLCVGSSLARG
jgi:hypothetical protein